MRVEFGVTAPAPRLGLELAARCEGLHQIDDKGDRDLEMRRRRMPRPPAPDKLRNTLTQIKRIGLRHRDSPPGKVNHNPSLMGIPSDSNRKSAALECDIPMNDLAQVAAHRDVAMFGLCPMSAVNDRNSNV